MNNTNRTTEPIMVVLISNVGIEKYTFRITVSHARKESRTPRLFKKKVARSEIKAFEVTAEE
jgi:hypothetical protein